MSVAHERAEKAALVLMGGEHSGCSILRRLLSPLGFRQGNSAPAGPPATFDVPGEAADVSGEVGDIARLNNAIIQELGSAWDRPAVFVARGRPPLESAIEVDALVTRRYLGAAAAALNVSYGDATRIVLGDPLVALFPGLWDAALRQCGFAAHRVLIVRNPIETADWLHRNRGLGRPRGIQLWLRDTMSALTLPAGRPAAIIRLDQLRRDKASLVFGLLDRLGLGAADAEMHRPALDRLINDELREDLLPPEFLYRRPLISALVKDVYRLCVGWSDIEPQARDDAVSALAARFEEFCLCASSFAAVPATLLEASGTPAPTAATRPTVIAGGNAGRAEQKRTVIVHYHLFKNAGTSVDAILRKNFGDAWAAREYVKQSRPEMAASVRAFLLEHPEIKALASHTLLLPPPELPEVDVFPVIFVRHPLDRLKSAYTFEREQQADTYGARLAKETDFAGYIRAHLENPANRVCRNFHAARFAMMEPPRNGTELERALRAFDTLPFIGAVEAFGASMQRLQTLLMPRIPNFRIFEASENVSRSRRTLDDRISEIRAELGDELFDTLAAANADDFVVHRRALEQYADKTRPSGTTAKAPALLSRSPRKLYVHVGPPKTGTSAIQHYFRTHNDPAVLYPKVGLWADGAHHNLVLNFYKDFDRPELMKSDVGEMFNQIGREAKATTGALLISSETLAGRDVGSFINALLPYLGDGWEPEILVVCREHFERAASLYNQYVKDPVSCERQGPDELLRRYPETNTYSQLIGALRLSGHQVTAMNYHPVDDFLQRFLQYAGINILEPIENERRNLSLSTKGLIATLAANNVARTPAERNRYLVALRRMRPFYAPSRFIFSPEAAQIADTAFAQDRQFLLDEFGIQWASTAETVRENRFYLEPDDLNEIAAAVRELGAEGNDITEYASRYANLGVKSSATGIADRAAALASIEMS